MEICMQVETFLQLVGGDFYTGVPDSQLSALCNYLMDTYGIDNQHHIIAANEGNCVALAAGYHLATGKVPVVYMQNSGEGNIINPVASLLNEEVYGIPMIFVIGWRGEPGVKDEPQHIYQGKITIQLLKDMGIESYVVGRETTKEDIAVAMKNFQKILSRGKNVAFVIRKGSLEYENRQIFKNDYSMIREEIIRHVVNISAEDPVISTTGKASRELFEIRDERGQSHKYDFLTVGSMGHSSSIALGVALNKPDKTIWCIDGDGAVLMHMGAMAVIGANAPNNFIHIVINNGAHETVGGMPTVAEQVNISEIAKACGYPYVVSISDLKSLERELKLAKKRNTLSMIEVKCSIGARKNLGRPTIPAIENKDNFMEMLKS